MTSPGARAALAVISLVLITACGGTAGPPQQELTVAPPARPAVTTQVADPVRIRIPAIGVDAAVLRLAVDAQGVLPPPPTNEDTGWWQAGPEPGEPGPAVLVGHVDSSDGPAVFYRLRELGPGDMIIVDRADGSAATFTVERLERHSKDAFPTEAVYGRTPVPLLRLVTCGGEFDRSTRHYLDNVIVFAALAA